MNSCFPFLSFNVETGGDTLEHNTTIFLVLGTGGAENFL